MIIGNTAKLLLAGSLLALTVATASAATEMKMFITSQGLPGLWRQVLDKYQADHPDVKVTIEAGGNTSDVQAQISTP